MSGKQIYFWTDDENAILRRLYPDHNVTLAAVIAALEPRQLSAKAIYKHAGELGLHRTRSPQRELDPVVRELIQCRHARSLGRAHIARQLGVSEGYLRRVEKGQRKFTRTILERWAALFDKRLGLVDLYVMAQPAKLRLMAGR